MRTDNNMRISGDNALRSYLICYTNTLFCFFLIVHLQLPCHSVCCYLKKKKWLPLCMNNPINHKLLECAWKFKQILHSTDIWGWRAEDVGCRHRYWHNDWPPLPPTRNDVQARWLAWNFCSDRQAQCCSKHERAENHFHLCLPPMKKATKIDLNNKIGESCWFCYFPTKWLSFFFSLSFAISFSLFFCPNYTYLAARK